MCGEEGTTVFDRNASILNMIYQNVSLAKYGEYGTESCTTEEQLEVINKHYRNAIKLLSEKE
jgi:hypothetical protein